MNQGLDIGHPLSAGYDHYFCVKIPKVVLLDGSAAKGPHHWLREGGLARILEALQTHCRVSHCQRGITVVEAGRHFTDSLA